MSLTPEALPGSHSKCQGGKSPPVSGREKGKVVILTYTRAFCSSQQGLPSRETGFP